MITDAKAFDAFGNHWGLAKDEKSLEYIFM
jgi:hypothetical protein